MKKILVLACVLSMVMALACVASADTDWLVYFKAYNKAATGNTAGFGKFGEAATALNEFKSFEDTKLSSLGTTAAGIYAIDLDPAYMWNTDKRKGEAGVDKVWNLRLQTGTAFPDAQSTLKMWVGSGATEVFTAGADETLKLYDANDNLVYDFTGKAAGSETAGYYSILVDAPAGTTVSYKLVHSYVVTPEPGSIVALLSGLAGLGGLVIRRKK